MSTGTRRHAILQVRWGPLAYQKTLIEPGQVLSVYFEKTTPPREPEQPAPPVLAAHKARALEVLRAQEAPLYALVDAARGERILELLHESVEDCYSLYEGPQGVALAEVAPYLVSLPRKDSWLLEALVQEGWGAHWGVFLTSAAPARQVRRHFRKFLMVEAEGVEGRLYFRYYDPRVLGAFLPSCPPGTREEFFGDIEGFIFSGSNGEVTVELPSLDGKRPPGRNGTRG